MFKTARKEKSLKYRGPLTHALFKPEGLELLEVALVLQVPQRVLLELLRGAMPWIDKGRQAPDSWCRVALDQPM